MPITILKRFFDEDPEQTQPELWQKAVERVHRYFGEAQDERFAAIHTNERETSGWLEWIIVMDTDLAGDYQKGRSMTVGMIQREPGAAVEFHS